MTTPIHDSANRTALSAEQTAEAVARRSYGKLIAYLAARSGDVAAAEDALSDAFTAALIDWPRNGCPQNPEAWLLTVARRKLIDSARRRKNETDGEDIESTAVTLAEAAGHPEIPDRRLALLFACAHPAIDAAVRAPLMLQTVLGLDAGRIASAFLLAPSAMSQRLVRAKTKIRQAGIPFRVPERVELAERLETVLDAIYGAFAEGWSDAAGTDLARRDLAEEAIYLCRLVTEMLHGEPEALGLLALMLYAEARRPARRGPTGDFVPLSDQDTARWSQAQIAEAEAALLRASKAGSVGRYQLEAAIQSAHIARRRMGVANWPAVVALYDALLLLTGSPVAAINRAVALAEAEGPDAALDALEAINGDRRLSQYQPYWAARADLLARCGAIAEAKRCFEIAIGLERDPAVRQFLSRRFDAL